MRNLLRSSGILTTPISALLIFTLSVPASALSLPGKGRVVAQIKITEDENEIDLPIGMPKVKEGKKDQNDKKDGEENKDGEAKGTPPKDKDKDKDKDANTDTPSLPKSRQKMVGSDSKNTGVECPLVDNRPYAQLVKAASTLYANVGALRSCQNDADAASIASTIQGLIETSKRLHSTITDPESVQEGTEALKHMETEVTALVAGIEQVSNQLMTSKLLNSDCEKTTVKKSDIVFGISDLIKAVSPYALTLAKLNPEFTSVVPFILGISGMGNVANVLKKINDDNAFNLRNDAKLRQAILMNICEFSRIQTRMNAFYHDNSETARSATDEMEKYASIKNALTLQFSPRVAQMASLQYSRSAQLDNIEAQAREDLASVEKQKSQMQQSGKGTCYVAQQTAKMANVEIRFPGRTVGNLQSLQLQSSNQDANQSLLGAEAQLRQRLAVKYADVGSDAGYCADDGMAYLDIIGSIASNTLNEVKKQRSKLTSIMQTDSEFAQFMILDQNVTREMKQVATLGQIGSAMAQMNVGNKALDMAELLRHMRDIKPALFDARKGSGYLSILESSDSPALAWLKDAKEQTIIAQNEFENEFMRLKSEVYAKQSRSASDATTPATTEAKEVREASSLALLTLPLVQTNAQKHRYVCVRLESIRNSWIAVVNGVATQELVCNTIAPYIQTGEGVQKELKDYCDNNDNFAGKVYEPRTISELSQSLYKASNKHAQVIYNKYQELKCSQF